MQCKYEFKTEIRETGLIDECEYLYNEDYVVPSSAIKEMKEIAYDAKQVVIKAFFDTLDAAIEKNAGKGTDLPEGKFTLVNSNTSNDLWHSQVYDFDVENEELGKGTLTLEFRSDIDVDSCGVIEVLFDVEGFNGNVSYDDICRVFKDVGRADKQLFDSITNDDYDEYIWEY